MKYILPVLALFAIAFWGCEERELTIPELTVGARRVLVEELTGVKCTNCPDGTNLLVDLQNTYGAENLVVVAVHYAPGFNDPYTGANASKYDFKTEDGTAMAKFVGTFEGAPSAAIARILRSRPAQDTALRAHGLHHARELVRDDLRLVQVAIEAHRDDAHEQSPARGDFDAVGFEIDESIGGQRSETCQF